MTEKVKTVIAFNFLLPNFKSRRQPTFTAEGLSGWFGSQAGPIDNPFSQYLSSFAEFLFEYNPISTKTWNRNCCIWWYIIEQQTSATIHMWISSWYWRRFGVNDFKHLNSIWGQCYQFWNFTISSNRQRRQNWPWWFHWSVDWTKHHLTNIYVV